MKTWNILPLVALFFMVIDSVFIRGRLTDES